MLALLALALGLLLALTRGARESALPPASPALARVPAAGASARGADPEPVSEEVLALARGPLPRSLRGSDVDGGLAIGADGRFLATPDALALFDYFLAASGEEPPELIRQRIVDRIRAELPAAAAAEAEGLLERYLGFRAALRELVESGAAPGDLERRLQWIRELRREHFGALAEPLFGESESALRVDLERRRIALEPDLSEDERREQLRAMDERLPERIREARRAARAPAEVRAEIALLRAAAGSEADVFALREQRFGSEAAERLAALDLEQQRWRERLQAYQAERDQLIAEHEAAGSQRDERESALETLRRAHFDQPELHRVRALDGLVP